jgi:GTP cyclohydrolase-4
MRVAVSNESRDQVGSAARRCRAIAVPRPFVACRSTTRRWARRAPNEDRALVSNPSPTRPDAVAGTPRATLAGVQAIGSSTVPRALDGSEGDVQARAPRVQLGLSRVGVTGVEKVIRIRDELFFARLECFVDLSREQKGAHMSRFEEVVNEAIGEVVLSESPFRAETLAQHIAELVRARQGAERAEVTIAARYPEHRPAPVSGIQTQEIYTLHGRAVAYAHGTRRTVGVSATGMTACPCAQELVAARARERLLADGFEEQQIERIFDRVPVATHNQRGLATLQIGCVEDCVEQIDAETLLSIAESSMSSEIYELMKRSDEVAVVEKAHRRPRFVEDCVREMVAGVLRELPQLDGRNFVSARQENLETIHQHNVVAERHGTLSELRSEIETGELPLRQTSLEQWLDAGRRG